jgi:hypothetical protein
VIEPYLCNSSFEVRGSTASSKVSDMAMIARPKECLLSAKMENGDQLRTVSLLGIH